MLTPYSIPKEPKDLGGVVRGVREEGPRRGRGAGPRGKSVGEGWAPSPEAGALRKFVMGIFWVISFSHEG